MVCVFVQYKFAVIVMGRQEYITEEDKPISMNQFMPQHLHGQCMGLHNLFGFVFGSWKLMVVAVFVKNCFIPHAPKKT